jgi:type III secretion system YscQ/HrcQ family protein
VSGDGKWSEEDEATAIFDTGGWELPPTAGDEGSAPEEESTLLLDGDALTQRLRQIESPQKPPQKPPQEQRKKRSEPERKTADPTPVKAPIVDEPLRARWLVDGEEVSPFPFDELRCVGLEEKKAYDGLAKILPPRPSTEVFEDQLAARLERVTGEAHRVSWTGADAFEVGEDGLRLDDGVWTWAHMPPGHSRILVGAQCSLVDRWATLVGPGPRALGDQFEFGLATFVIAEFCAQLCSAAGWPAWTWAVNPMSGKELTELLLSDGEGLLELVFKVRCSDDEGAVRIVLPWATVRHLKAQMSPNRHDSTDLSESTWWGGLMGRWPMVVGTVGLEGQELEQLRVGDILIFERHGVVADDVKESSVEDGARWLISDERVLGGSLLGDESGRWKFEFRQEQIMSNREQVALATGAAQGAEECDEGPGINVEAVRLELEVRMGSVEMALADVARLRPGQVIDCGRPLGSPVELVVRGASVGSGELVCVDGRLGVRILTMQVQ